MPRSPCGEELSAWYTPPLLGSSAIIASYNRTTCTVTSMLVSCASGVPGSKLEDGVGMTRSGRSGITASPARRRLGLGLGLTPLQPRHRGYAKRYRHHSQSTLRLRKLGHAAPTGAGGLRIAEAVVRQLAAISRAVPAEVGRDLRHRRARLLEPEQGPRLVRREVLKTGCRRGHLLMPRY